MSESRSASAVTPEPLLRVHEICAGYGAIEALHGISLQVQSGEIVALIGANGAGKSSLLMSICANPPARKGKIFFAGQDITVLATHQIARLGVAHVPEGRRVFTYMTVAENLAMGLMALPEQANHGLLQAGGGADPEQIYHLFPRLRERAQQRAGTLSGGEQQMLAIGRALMSRPRLLLLDEPSLGLAPQIMGRIFATLRDIVKEGTTIFLVEQNANQALQLADRAYVLVNGRITLSGTGKELLASPEIRKAYLGGH
ncbi:ABC transporter ATP-binding protein [Candidatus Magnetaquicoccus inordinatus]|uniref:ABC transporter ATP-binding protein n=1 Tax=Candidatus Magnetaquicoccus inordinatus TaxID=2496818 RepID=UPI00102B4C11|nr:ABC transporter ATP-binding protein [Candidatus Magnetaquicoccus inordinatus]